MQKIIFASLFVLGGSLGAATDNLNLQSLDERLKIAERKLELAAETAGAAKTSDAVVSVGSGGFVVHSADKSWNFKLGGVLQADNRTFFEDQLKPQANTNVLRRARFQVDAGLGSKAKVRIQTELATGTIVDAYGELKLLPWASLRTGLFKTPLSLERWRSDPNRDFIELGYTTALVTDRDTGAWLELADADQVVSLGAGVFNGSVDNGSVITADTDDDKDVVAKLFTHPFRAVDLLSLRDLGFGVAASSGNRSQAAAPGANQVRPLGQGAGIYSYQAGSVADGASLRVVPQLYWFFGSLSLLSEYVYSTQHTQRLANTAFDKAAVISNEAYQVQLGWVLTGEDASFTGLKRNKETSSDWGVLQLMGRYQGVNFDKHAFTRYNEFGTGKVSDRFIDPRSSVSGIQSWGLGLNYIPVNNVKILLDWEESSFSDGASKGTGVDTVTVNRETEKVLFTRFQFTY